MNDHHENVSIAYAVVNITGAMARTGSDRLEDLAVGVLTRARHDNAPTLCRELSAALGMEVLEIDVPAIEYHTGAMSVGIGKPFEAAVAAGRPVMVILREAQAAQGGVLEAAMSIIARRVERQPCAILAISNAHGERHVAESMAEGLGRSVDRIVMHRTEAENARITERVLDANPA